MFEYLSDNVIFPLAATAIAAAILWASTRFSKWTGIQIEAKHREALHSALMTGVRMAVERLGPAANKTSLTTEALRHVNASVPDAIKKLRPDVDRLEGLAQAKLQEVLTQVVSSVNGNLPKN